MNASEVKPCDICTHVRVKGDAPQRLVYYCVVHDQRTQPWETCPRFQREPGADDGKGSQ